MTASIWKKTGITLIILAGLLLTSAYFLPGFLQPDRHRQLIVSKIEQATGGQVSFESISWGVDNGLWVKVKGFSIQGATQFPADLSLPVLELSLELIPLFSRQIIINNLSVLTPEVTLHLAKNLKPDQEIDDLSDIPDPSFPFTLILQNFSLTQGELMIKDKLTAAGQEISTTLSDVSIHAKEITFGQAINFQFTFNSKTRDAVGRVTGKGVFHGVTPSLSISEPQLELTASGKKLPASLLKSYIADEALAAKLDGSVSLELEYQGSLDANFNLDGSINFSDFNFKDASLWENALPGQSAMIEYQLSANPEQLDIRRLSVKLGELSLSAESIIHDWRQEQVIKKTTLSGILPLSTLDRLIPWVLLDEQGVELRKTVRQQGEISLQQLTLPEVKLSSIIEDPLSILSLIEGLATVSDIVIESPLELPGIEVTSGTIKLHKGMAEASGLEGRMGPLSLPPVNIKATDLAGSLQISASAKGPMQLAASKHTGLSTLLREYDLKSLSGKTDIDFQLNYDQSKTHRWFVSSDLVLNGVNMTTYKEGVQLADLYGRIKLKQDKGLDISIERLRGKLENNFFHLNGNMLSVGNPGMQIDAIVHTKQLDLSSLSTLFRVLKPYNLQGKLDSDINIHYLHADPLKTRFDGHIDLQEVTLQLMDNDLSIKDGKSLLELKGNSVTIKKTSFRINEQLIKATGSLSNPAHPSGWLNLSSPRLNINKILPSGMQNDKQTLSKSKQKTLSTSRELSWLEKYNSEEQTLPGWFHNLSLKLKAEITKGELNGQSFSNFMLTTHFMKGLLKNQVLESDIEKGHIKSVATIDLRNPQAITFSIQHDFNNVEFQALEKLTGKLFSINGPVTFSGKLKGTAGNSKTFLKSIKGDIELQSGPGYIDHDTSWSKPLFAVLSVIKLKNLLPGSFDKNFSETGTHYTSLNIISEISDGILNLEKLNLIIPAMIINSTGSIDLADLKLDLEADVTIFDKIDTLVGVVPVVGTLAKKLTGIVFDITGTLDNATVKLRPDRQIKKAIEEAVTKPFSGLREVFKQKESLNNDE